MSLCKRLIARLDIKGNKLIKGIRFEGLRVLGDPVETANRYAKEGIDEMLFIDAVASLYGRNSLTDILRQTTKKVFVPITAGGGIRNVADAAKLLASGADKIAINSEALKRPKIITELAKEFGSQCVVVSIQARRISELQWEAMGEAGRERSSKNVIAWIKEVQEHGAGEILLTSIDQDGTCEGPDYQLIKQASENISIPLVVCGGFSTNEDVNKSFEQNNVAGIAIGTAFHKNKLDIKKFRRKLKEEKINIRQSNLKTKTTTPDLKEYIIGIIDYGMGNQQSLTNAIEHLGGRTRLSDQWDELKNCDLLMLPGVGAFPEGIKKLKQRNLFSPLIEWGKSEKPLIGICLGMQMLFKKGEEFEITQGLGFFEGTIKRLNPYCEKEMTSLPLPHMGWNQLTTQNTSMGQHAEIEQYFVHSYAAKDVDRSIILHATSYGNEEIVASIKKHNICGFQFHPERSGEEGLSLLKDAIAGLLGVQ